MKTRYLECNRDAAGDRPTADLSGLIEKQTDFMRWTHVLGLPGANAGTAR